MIERKFIEVRHFEGSCESLINKYLSDGWSLKSMTNSDSRNYFYLEREKPEVEINENSLEHTSLTCNIELYNPRDIDPRLCVNLKMFVIINSNWELMTLKKTRDGEYRWYPETVSANGDISIPFHEPQFIGKPPNLDLKLNSGFKKG